MSLAYRVVPECTCTPSSWHNSNKKRYSQRIASVHWHFIPSSFCPFFRLFSFLSLIFQLLNYLLSTCALGSLFIVLYAWSEFSINYTHPRRHSNIPLQQESTDQITEIYLPSRRQKSSDLTFLVDRFTNIVQLAIFPSCRYYQPSQWHLFFFSPSSRWENRETWTGCDSGVLYTAHTPYFSAPTNTLAAWVPEGLSR